ncbi:MAG: MFS transporter [Thermodesulfobacteriota bacterium]
MGDNQQTNKRLTLLMTTSGAFVVPFMGSSVNIALPSIGKEFAMDAIMLSWVTTSYILASAAFQVPAGRIADIFGRKKVFLWGFVIHTFFSLLCVISRDSISFIVFRFLQGVGGSMTFSTGTAILMSVFPVEERGKVLGVNVAAVYVGLSCGPFVGGVLTYSLGWRSIFLITVPIGFLIILFTLLKIKGEWVEAKGESFDLTGSILFIITLTAIIYGFSLLPGPKGSLLILFGAVMLPLFVKWEIRSKASIFNIDLFRRNRVFAFSNIAAFINYGATFAVTFLLSLYLQYVKGLNPQGAGLILIAQPIFQAVFSPFAGKLSDRIEPGKVASTGMAITAVGLFLFIFLREKTAISFIIANLAFMGIGFSLFSSPNTNAVMSSIEKKYYGVASGTLGTMRTVGMMFSMGMVMLVFSLYIGRTQITPSSYPLFVKSMKAIFIFSTALCVAGIFASLSRGRVRRG